MNAQKARTMLLNGESNLEKIKKAFRWVGDVYFIPNTSGYETLKSSGYLGKLKNTKIDTLLHSYYTQIEYIKNKEKSFNEYIENMETEFIINHSFITYYELIHSDSISDKYTISVREEKLRPFIFSMPYQGAIHRTARFGTDSYLKLIKIGKEYIKEVETNINPE